MKSSRKTRSKGVTFVISNIILLVRTMALLPLLPLLMYCRCFVRSKRCRHFVRCKCCRHLFVLNVVDVLSVINVEVVWCILNVVDVLSVVNVVDVMCVVGNQKTFYISAQLRQAHSDTQYKTYLITLTLLIEI